jgi:hypothetical protein
MKKQITLALILFSLVSIGVLAQLPHDAIYMPKRSACLALNYSNSRWEEYWEGSLKRENLNIGRLTTQSIMPMFALGVTDKLNILAGLPYVTTQASAGNLLGQKGLQDLSLWLKYKLAENEKGLSIHVVGGASTPVSNYVADFLPMSIGFKSKTLTGRIIGHYQHNSGLYLTTHGSFTGRSNIAVDRDAYLAYGRMINTNEVALPNTVDGSLRIGYLKKAIQAEAFLERFACIGGDDIRRNDMPFPTNNMKMTQVGAYAKYQPKNIGINTRVNYVTSGLNVGQSLGYSIGILYQINKF